MTPQDCLQHDCEWDFQFDECIDPGGFTTGGLACPDIMTPQECFQTEGCMWDFQNDQCLDDLCFQYATPQECEMNGCTWSVMFQQCF